LATYTNFAEIYLLCRPVPLDKHLHATFHLHSLSDLYDISDPTKLPTYTASTSTYTPIIRIVQVTPTIDSSILKADKTDGFYLIGPEIAPGVWRTEPNKTKCYWKITGVKGEIISNYLGSGGGTIYIPKDAYQIEIQNCGKVTFVQSINN
jgi:hypothetical protein